MISTPVLCVSALAAFFYALGALVLKRANEYNIGVWRATFVCNQLLGLGMIPLWVFGGEFPGWGSLIFPAVTGALLVAGQALAILALSKGDVSVATPLLGVKIIMVAFCARLLFGEVMPGRLWIAVVLASVAMVLMNLGGKAARERAGFTIVVSLCAAAAFALFDVLVQYWATPWGVGRYLPVMGVFTSLFSLGFIPLFSAPMRELPRPAVRWIWLAAGLLSGQSILFVSMLAIWGEAAVANVIYSSRGIWSIVLVWFLGHSMAKEERKLGGKVLAFRLAGAVVLSIAILILLI
jgi:drug/metabolite transporter (DMT)-like permease